MNKLVSLCLMMIALSVLTSCEKNYDSDIEIIENELKQFVSDNDIAKCTVVLLMGETMNATHQNMEFSINKGLFIIKDNNIEYRYNLSHIVTYNLVTYPEKLMYIYFN